MGATVAGGAVAMALVPLWRGAAVAGVPLWLGRTV